MTVVKIELKSLCSCVGSGSCFRLTVEIQIRFKNANGAYFEELFQSSEKQYEGTEIETLWATEKRSGRMADACRSLFPAVAQRPRRQRNDPCVCVAMAPS